MLVDGSLFSGGINVSEVHGCVCKKLVRLVSPVLTKCKMKQPTLVTISV